MATFRPLYANSSSLTVTNLQSLGSSTTVFWQSAKQTNASALYDDVLVQVTLKTQNSGSVSAPSCAFIWAVASVDNSTWPDAYTGSEGTFTAQDANGFLFALLDTIAIGAINTSYGLVPLSLAQAFGGTLPEYWGLVIRNACGTAFASSGNAVAIQGVQGEFV